MRSTRTIFTTLLLAATVLISTQIANAQQLAPKSNFVRDASAAPAAEAGGIKEVIPAKYQKRYEEWKTEFLSTDIGKAQWEMYSHHPRLQLTITIGGKSTQGAGTGKYKWNDSGELVAATIMLGEKIDEGYPSAVYYPVMNALEPFESKQLINGSVLAATKIAHEFGHVMKISTTSQSLYNLQVQLFPLYNKIFLSNGYNVNDPRLVEMAQKMGGTPVEIWEDREYWGEVGAMLFLRDITARQNYQCVLFNRIREFVELYAKPYRDRFAEVADAPPASDACSWP